MQRSIFRNVALDRLASPEQLDQLLEPAPRWPRPALPRGVAWIRLWRSRARAGQRVRTPTVLQMEAVECGAAALAMVLGFHGRFVALGELRTVCGVSRDGSKASNLLRAAQGYGLQAKGYKKDIDALHGLPLPLIVFWNFNHFVVVEGFGADCVFLNDPAAGPRTVSADEFDGAYTGVVLVFRPGPDFVRGGTRPSNAGVVLALLAGQRLPVLLAAAAALALLVPTLAFPVLVQRVVDGLIGQGAPVALPTLVLALALTAALSAVVSWLNALALLRLELRIGAASGRVVAALLRLPVGFFAQRAAGEIAARVALSDRNAALIGQTVLPAVFGGATLLGATLLMLSYDVTLTLAVLALALASIVLPAALRRARSNGQRRLLHAQAQLEGAAYAGLQSLETLKATGGEAAFFERWAGLQARVVNSEGQLARQDQLQLALPALLRALAAALVVGGGSVHVAAGSLTLGGLIALQSLSASLLGPLARLALLGGAVADVAQGVERVGDLLDHPAATAAAVFALPVERQRLTGHVELRDVTFGYSPMEPPLIQNLSLTLAPGRRVALVGGSGSGKSTVARLVAGLHEPWSGAILFDGAPRAAHAPATMSSSLALVDQEIAIFAGTIRDNLTLWDATVSDEVLIAAARDALLHDEVLARPGGYDGPLAAGGYELSGGQRQRLEIARGLVQQPAVLVLDEATSALDPLTEQRVDANLRRRSCACLIVAHRLSTVRDADEIIVLDHGMAVQRGTHVELAAVPGIYRQLMEADTPA